MGLIIKNNKVIQYAIEENETEVTIPDGVTEIGEMAFCGSNEIKKINIPSSVVKIERAAFKDCSSLSEIVLPPNIKTINEMLFYNCPSLEKIIIPDGVVELGNGAFAFCRDLKEITIPSSVEKIDMEQTSKFIEKIPIFFWCLNLKKINLYSYKQFSLLYNSIALFSFLQNYYTGKINYSSEDIKKFMDTIIENKMYLFEEVLKKRSLLSGFSLILNNIKPYTSEEIDVLLEETFDNENNNIELTAMLLEYKNNNFGFDDPLDYLNLDDDEQDKKTL